MVCLKTRHGSEYNPNSMVRGAFSSHHGPHHQKAQKKVSIIREGPHHQKPRETTVDNAHKVLLPPIDEADHDTPIVDRLIGAYHYDTCMCLFPYTPLRRRHGVGRGQPLTDPSPGTIPQICSPSPVFGRVFLLSKNFIQESWIFFFTHKTVSNN